MNNKPWSEERKTLAWQRALNRFWNDVRKTRGCWIWLGPQMLSGYGVFAYGKKCGWKKAAHRMAYELVIGPIPAGLQLDHLCRNRQCVNPKHLEPVTVRINVLRGVGITALNARKTHCPRHHPYSRGNTYRTSSGKRVCRTCNRLRKRAH
jgi:hypothetical protein